MKHARILFFTVLGFAAACSGYDGGGDVLVAGGVFDGGSSTTDGGGNTPGSDSGGPRVDGGSTDARADAATGHPSGVVAYYPFDGDGTDQSPALLGLNLSISNASFQPGRVGSGLYLTASGPGAVRPQIDAVFTFASRDFTVQAWVAATGVLGTRGSFGGGSGGWMLFSTQASVGFLSDDPEPFTVQVPATNAFRHVVVRRMSGMLSLFVNGSNIANRNSTGPISAGVPLSILRATNDVAGIVDEVAIWSRALSDSEINNNFVRGNGGMPAQFTE